MVPILPKSPAPAFGTIIPSGDVKLTWKNLAPKTGRDVAVDVWFAAKPDAMKQVVDGKINLGTWQRLFVIELDRARPRTVSLMYMGRQLED